MYFGKVFVDQVDAETVSVTRHNPVSHQSVILVAHTVFSTPANLNSAYSQTLQIPGTNFNIEVFNMANYFLSFQASLMRSSLKAW
jgi:hypothetical protein